MKEKPKEKPKRPMDIFDIIDEVIEQNLWGFEIPKPK